WRFAAVIRKPGMALRRRPGPLDSSGNACARRRSRAISGAGPTRARFPPMPATSTRRFSTIVFDLDGTLVDSAPDLCGVVNDMLRQHGRVALDMSDIRKMVGDGAAKLIERG